MTSETHHVVLLIQISHSVYTVIYLLFMVMQQHCTYLLSSRSRSGS